MPKTLSTAAESLNLAFVSQFQAYDMLKPDEASAVSETFENHLLAHEALGALAVVGAESSSQVYTED